MIGPFWPVVITTISCGGVLSAVVTATLLLPNLLDSSSFQPILQRWFLPLEPHDIGDKKLNCVSSSVTILGLSCS